MTTARDATSDVDAHTDRPMRNIRRRRGDRRASTIKFNIAPMIDVTFLLLIFFLVTTTFERAEGILASQMPKDSSRASIALPLSPIVVRLSQVGMDFGEYEIHIDHFSNRPGSFDELYDVLGHIHEQPGFDKDTPVVIMAGDDVRWDHVVGCWNAALRAGCTKIAFGEP